MDAPIVSKPHVLRIYDEARKTLDPISAIEHVAGLTGLDAVAVEGVVAARESRQSAPEDCA